MCFSASLPTSKADAVKILHINVGRLTQTIDAPFGLEPKSTKPLAWACCQIEAFGSPSKQAVMWTMTHILTLKKLIMGLVNIYIANVITTFIINISKNMRSCSYINLFVTVDVIATHTILFIIYMFIHTLQVKM